LEQGSRYRAFISYSHADKACAGWLHRTLETYRIPARLVGTAGALGPVPARLAPIFKDREELPAAGDLSVELKAALARSMFLIVVASPAAAVSRWVNEEVLQFKAMHGEGRVLALIADGDPGGVAGPECFPPALKFQLVADGTVGAVPAEPIAADLRPGGDGKRLSRLKLVAGLSGVPLDALVQREAQRRQRRLGALAAAAAVLAALMGVLALFAVQGQREAERQRAEADGLIEFMLTDLRQKLEPVGRLEVLDSVGQRAMTYYGRQDLGRLDPEALGRRARALNLVGEVRDLRGDGEAALKAFREAERTTAELLARDPDDPDRMFDHAQSSYFVGQLAWQRSDWATAEAKFRRYEELAGGMLAIDPANPKWQAETGYAANSLGALYLRTGRAAEAVPHFRKYVAVTRRLLDRSSGDAALRWEAGQAKAWLADALVETDRLAEARHARLAELELYNAILAADARNAEALAGAVRARDALAEIALLSGDAGMAAARIAL
jgi:hypothetical protein